jgi:hypothetical protein
MYFNDWPSSLRLHAPNRLAVVDDRVGRRYTYGEQLDEDGAGSSAGQVHPEFVRRLVLSKTGHTPYLERPLEFQSALINHLEAQY